MQRHLPTLKTRDLRYSQSERERAYVLELQFAATASWPRPTRFFALRAPALG